MTFEQWWKEYCVKHSIVVGSSFERGVKDIAEESWDVSHEDAYWEGYKVGYEAGWCIGYESRS